MKKIFLNNIFLNILSSGIVIFILQLCIYPFLSTYYFDNIYGKILTAMSILNILSSGVGSSLNVTRLVMNHEYENKNIIGDFNLLFIIFTSITSTIEIILFIYFRFNWQTLLLLLLLLLLSLAKNYYSVSFRLIIDYKKIFYLDMITSLGYLLGLLLFFIVKVWPFLFLFGDLFACIFIFCNSSLMKEKMQKTVLFKKTLHKTIFLILSTSMASITIYLDRLILYLLDHADFVAIYSAASFFGKSMSLVFIPVNGILINYFCNNIFTLNKKRYLLLVILDLVFLLVFIFSSYIFSPLITRILYPTLFKKTIKYIFVANVAALFGVSSSLMQAITFKSLPTYYQLWIQIFYSFTYISLGVILLKNFNLMGFCLANLIANAMKLVLFFLLGYFYNKIS